MAELKRMFTIAVIVIMFGLGLLGFISDLYDNNSYNIDVKNGTISKFESNFSESLNEAGFLVNQISSKTQSSGGIQVLEAGTLVLTGAYNIILMPFKLISLFMGWLSILSTEIGLPYWVGGGIVILMTSAIAFAILGAIFRRDI